MDADALKCVRQKTMWEPEDPYRPDIGHGYKQCYLYLSVSTEMVMDTATES